MAMALSQSQIWPKLRQWGGSAGRALRSGAKQACVWFVPMFLTAAATAWLSYKYNQRSNAELAVQQQTFSDLQAFRNSGAELDQSLGVLSDAIIDGRGVSEAKSKMRNAISRHVSDGLGTEKSLGLDSRSYIERLAHLRMTVDEVDPHSVETGATLWQESLKLMSERRRLVASAELRAGKL